DILSHKFPNQSESQVVAYALKMTMEKSVLPGKEGALHRKRGEVNPVQNNQASIEIMDRKTSFQDQSTSVAEASRRAATCAIKSSKHLSCSYKDPITKKICGSTYQVQTDHI